MNRLAIALLLISGCGPLVAPNGPVAPSPIKPTHCTTVWCELAKLVESDRIADTDKLILIVDRLRELEAIDDMGRVRFYEAFPDVRATRRNITDADAETLRGLK